MERSEPINSSRTSGEHQSYWIASSQPIIFERVIQPISTDVLIIGGGISGLSTAYCLARAGRLVTLVEDGFIGSGESGRTTAHLTCALDDRYYEIEKIFGKEKSVLAANSHMAAIEWIANTILLEKINCSFKRVDGYLFLHSTDTKDTLEKEYAATKNAGLLTEMLEHIPAIAAEEGKWCIKFPGQGQFHIMSYLKGLADAIVRMGGKIYTESRAEDINEKGAKVNGYEVNANHIVVATNTPINDRLTMHTKQWPYRSYVIGAKIKKGVLPYSLWWDSGNQESKWITKPYHYVRLEELDEQYDVLISGGEDHKTGQADEENIPEEERYTRLIEWTKKRFPAIEEIAYRWSGQVMEPVDALAFIGKNPGNDNIYIVTGDSGNGMTHGTLGGIIISDIITGKNNPWIDLYDPSRITLKTADDYLIEVGDMTAQMVIDWIKPGDIKEAEDLKPGEGGILSSGLKKIALYRNAQNCLHAHTAVCPHLGGILHWNKDEKSFDCPLHGSRFTTDGKVINGPAKGDLKKIDVRDDQ